MRWPIELFSTNTTSTSTSTALLVRPHARPPITRSNGDSDAIRARKYPAASSSSMISPYLICAHEKSKQIKPHK